MTYSALISHSSKVADMPRLIMTGLSWWPTAFKRSKFCMFRAPIWITSTSLKRGSWVTSISSVTMGSPVSCRATFKYSSPVAPRPWKA